MQDAIAISQNSISTQSNNLGNSVTCKLGDQCNLHAINTIYPKITKKQRQ